MTPREVKILHCADLHLGAEFSSLGEKSLQRRRELLFSFERIVMVCKEEAVDFLLIAGDLFEHVHIENQIFNELTDLINKIPNTVIAVTPGNHDPFSIDSLYYNRTWPDNVVIFKNDLSHVAFIEKNVCLWGAGFTSTYHPESFLANDLTSDTATGSNIEIDSGMINICIMHGDLVAKGTNSFYNPITKEQLNFHPFDYIALGHVHKRSEIQKINKTFYAYSGCPEGHGFDEPGEQGVYLGMLGKTRCSLEFHRICQRIYYEIPVDVSKLQTNQEIASQIIKTLVDMFSEDYRNHLYKILLTGEIPEYVRIDIDSISQRMETACFYIKIEDRTTIAVDYDTIAKDRSLKGLFVLKMQEEIEKAKLSRNERQLTAAQKALQYGLKAFEGEVRILENK